MPEWMVYSFPAEGLGGYLPEVYRSMELTPGVRYAYLLEDLSGGYEPRSDAGWMVAVASMLPEMHRAMNEWAARVGYGGLLRYDGGFHERLEEFVWRNLEVYLKTVPSSRAWEMWNARRSIEAVFRREEFRSAPAEQAIHGDFNPSNILRRRGGGHAMKVIDWEWAGLGEAHADLASLLKHAGAEVEDRVLRAYAGQDRRLSLDEHKRRYVWCKLGRAMLDSAFLAVHSLMCPYKAVFNVHNHIGRAAGNVVATCRMLGKAAMGALLGWGVDWPQVWKALVAWLGLCG